MSLFIIVKLFKMDLNEGEVVEFELYQSDRGLQAKNVVKV